MTSATATGASYFGKLPSRGDFVQGGTQSRLITLLDRWASASMEVLSENPRWKLIFDSAAGLDFAFVGAHSPHSVIGHLKPSRDASGRRFPLIAATAITRRDQLGFRYGPIGFSGLWGMFRSSLEAALDTDHGSNSLDALTCIDCAAAADLALRNSPLLRFARTTTLAQLSGETGSSIAATRRQILSIGLLLNPVSGRRQCRIERGLCLPLPDATRTRCSVAGFWLYLITAMLRETDCELQILLGRVQGKERMIIGFNGASPRTLTGVLSPATLDDAVLLLDDPCWIDTHPALHATPAIARLVSYLEHPSLTLEAVLNTFCEVFAHK